MLKLLPEIRDLGLITPQQYHELRDAYIFLRRTENVLQAIDDQQTQLLPTDEENRLRLMVACREYTRLDENNQTTMKSYPIENWDDFYQILQAHQQKVRSVFDALIGEEKDERTDDNNRWIDFLESDLDDIEQMLVDNHIDDDAISDILDKLIQFKEGLARRVIGSRGREVLAHLLPNIFTQIFEQKITALYCHASSTLSIKL